MLLVESDIFVVFTKDILSVPFYQILCATIVTPPRSIADVPKTMETIEAVCVRCDPRTGCKRLEPDAVDGNLRA
ncbi:MAG TPA: hypothetical protein VE154_00625, partial [Chthoniobacterales bacterium]|nr:hypothetical protein [Chthoniobacterales bacterium]